MSAQALVTQIPTQDNFSVDASNKLAETRNAISSLPWNLAVELVADAVGLPVTATLGSKDSATGPGSLARSLGHMQINSFVTNTQKSLGLGMNWEQFATDVRAHQFMNLYSISKTSSAQIIENVEMVTRLLNRNPANAAEYHRVINEHLTHQAKVDHERVSEELESVKQHAASLQRELDQSQDQAHKTEALLESIRQEAVELRQGKGLATHKEVTGLKVRLELLSEKLEVSNQKNSLLKATLAKSETANSQLAAVVNKRGQSLQRATAAINALKGERRDLKTVITYMGAGLIVLSFVAISAVVLSIF